MANINENANKVIRNNREIIEDTQIEIDRIRERISDIAHNSTNMSLVAQMPAYVKELEDAMKRQEQAITITKVMEYLLVE